MFFRYLFILVNVVYGNIFLKVCFNNNVIYSSKINRVKTLEIYEGSLIRDFSEKGGAEFKT